MARLSLKERKERLEKAIEVAKSRNGKFLSAEYLGVDFKYKWQCSGGHQWDASYYSVVQRGQWCGKCSGHIPDKELRLKRAIEIAKSKGGKCLSEKYKNTKEHLKWQCKNGHVWSASFSNTSKGKWCPFCAGNKVDAEVRIDEAIKYAKSKGGLCLSKKYTGNKAPMKWICKSGHEWQASFNTVVNRQAWCAYCHGTKRDPEQQLSLAIQIAESKGGQCLSQEYINNSNNLRWACERNHEWEAPFYVVVQAGSWCPVCSDGLRERLVRHTFEQLFSLPFPKKRPNWLVNSETGHKMELDGYNQELSVAFEYQGEQHSRVVKPFKMNKKKLESQQNRDELKKLLCNKNNILLIEVPHDISPDNYPHYIYTKIVKNKNSTSLKKKMRDWKLIKVKERIESDSYSILNLKKHAVARNGACLSETYKGALVKHKWQCHKNHNWSATWDSVNRGTWCPQCSGNIVDPLKRLEQAKIVAKKRGGTCLAKKYERANAKMRWRCRLGHEWESRYSHVVQGGSWCPKCREPRA